MGHNTCKAYQEYIEFFEEVAEINYGREARAIYDGGMHDSTMRNARTRYGSNAELNMQFIFNNFSSSRSVGQLKLKFMSNVLSKLVPGEPARRKIEAPDIYTIKCMVCIACIARIVCIVCTACIVRIVCIVCTACIVRIVCI